MGGQIGQQDAGLGFNHRSRYRPHSGRAFAPVLRIVRVARGHGPDRFPLVEPDGTLRKATVAVCICRIRYIPCSLFVLVKADASPPLPRTLDDR
jgi:hypothetical protein